MAVQATDTANAVRFLSYAPKRASLATGYPPLWVGDALFFIDIRGRLQRWNRLGIVTVAAPAAGPLWLDEDTNRLLFRSQPGDPCSAWAVDPAQPASAAALGAHDARIERYREFAEYRGLSRAFTARTPVGAALALQVLTESNVRLLLVTQADGSRDILELGHDGELVSRGEWQGRASGYDFTRDASGNGYLAFQVPGDRSAWKAGRPLEVRHVRNDGAIAWDAIPYADWAASGDFKLFDLASGNRLIATNVGHAPGTVALRGLWSFDGEGYRRLFPGSFDIDWSRRSGSGRFIALAAREADPPRDPAPPTLLIADSEILSNAQGDDHA